MEATYQILVMFVHCKLDSESSFFDNLGQTINFEQSTVQFIDIYSDLCEGTEQVLLSVCYLRLGNR